MTAEDAEAKQPANEREDPELVVKRYEEIYRFAQKAYDEENASSDLLEKRIFNFLTVSLVLLGLSFTLFTNATKALLASVCFLPTLIACVGATSIAVISFFWAIRAGKVKLPPVGRPPIAYLRDKTSYLEALDKLSEKFMVAAQFNSDNKAKKMARGAAVGYWSLLLAVLLFVLATAHYVLIC